MVERDVVLLLGADLGAPRRQLDQAGEAIERSIGRPLARSRDHWTRPWGFQADTLFLNRALLLSSPLAPGELLRACLAIEDRMGRSRPADGRPASRVIDIDILLVGSEVIDAPGLAVPHPRLHLRRFALGPLCDVLPAWEHPTLLRTALQLLNALPVE